MGGSVKDKGVLYRSYGFWMSVAAMALIIAKAILNNYGIKIEEKYLSDIADGVLALLVVAGVIVVPKGGGNEEEVILPDEDNGEDEGQEYHE